MPQDLVQNLGSAKIVITIYRSFKLRERMPLAPGSRALLEGRDKQKVRTLESEGQMMQRVMPSLMGMKRIMVLNDEAHHWRLAASGEAGRSGRVGSPAAGS